MRIRAAAVNWKIRANRGDSGFWGHLHDLISEAHGEGAQLVVLPELFCLELLPLAKDLAPEKAPRYLVQYADPLEDWLKRISQNSGMVIVGGSHFRWNGEQIRNVSAIAFPDGSLVFQEKNNLTVYERENWSIENGAGIVPLVGNLGVTVCYDSEFPEASRKLAEEGMLVQCVPAWTETQRGFQRVRWSCLARAVENQVFVIQSSLVGNIGREPVPESYGSSAIIAPSVDPFPVQAVLRETEINEEGVAVADLDLNLLAVARSMGEVTNWADRKMSDWQLIAHNLVPDDAQIPWENTSDPNSWLTESPEGN